MEIIKNKKAQAMLELSIMGSIFLSLLGILISYGVRYNAQQELMMKSFKDAVREASTDRVGANFLSYMGQYIKDISIPDVDSAYGVPTTSSVSSGASATRTYFMNTQEEPEQEAMGRVHFNINDTDTNPSGEGFSTQGLKGGASIKKEGDKYLVIKQIPDPEDKLEPTGVYWSWVEIKINSLTPAKDSYGVQSDQKIKDIFDEENEEVEGTVYNLGIDLGLNLAGSLSSPVSEEDLFTKVRDFAVLSQGDKLHSACLEGINTEYPITFIKITNYGDYVFSDGDDLDLNESWQPLVAVRSSAWAQINTKDVSQTARGKAKQGLLGDDKKEVSLNKLRAESTKAGSTYSTETEVDYEKSITRYIKLNPDRVEDEITGDEIEVKSGISEDSKKYQWETEYE